MIAGSYISEEAGTIEESKYLVYGFVRKQDYRRETVRYAVRHLAWFTSLVKHTVVSVGRGLFGASDQACGRILNNHDMDIVMEALRNVAEQPDFEQGLNYFSDESDRDKAMESYIGKMIAYTATEWVRTKLKEFEQFISFETVVEERGDSVFAKVIKELGLEDEDVKHLLDDFMEATVSEDAPMYEDAPVEEEPPEEGSPAERALELGVFVDETGVYRDCRVAIVIAMTVFGISQDKLSVRSGSLCDSLMNMYKNSPVYVMTSEKQEDSKASFSGAVRFGISLADVCGYGEVDEAVLTDKLYKILKECSLGELMKYSVAYLESGKCFV